MNNKMNDDGDVVFVSKTYNPSDLPLPKKPDWKKVFVSCIYYKIDTIGSPNDLLKDLILYLEDHKDDYESKH